MAVRLTLLGTFQAARTGDAPADAAAGAAESTPMAFATSATRALLAYLAMEGPQPCSRGHLASLLWTDVPQATAFANLRQTLLRLRRALNDPDGAVLRITPQSVQLNAAAITVDALQFDALLNACNTHAHADIATCPDCIARLQQAAHLYRGEFLHGMSMHSSQAFEEWALLKRENLHHKILQALRMLTQHAEATVRHQEACRHAQRQIELEPWREEAHQQLMRNLALSGQRSAALAQFEACREVLASELGITPGADTLALHEQIRSGQLQAPAAAASGLAFVSRHDWGDIPAADLLHGRESELAQLHQWLTQERCRVVSILGIGGMGKTTLAAAAARADADAFDVVIWRSLINAPPLDELLRNLLQILPRHTQDAPPGSLDERLRLLMRHLREQRCLLVLDNVESILQPGLPDQQRRVDTLPGYDGYALFFQRVAETEHNSCLLLTSREQPLVLARAGREKRALRQLPLSGLDTQAGTALLHSSGLPASGDDAAQLVQRYSGNPLALQLVANTIADYFGGNIAAFQHEDRMLFDSIRAVLDQQFERLSTLERDVLIWLAIEREPVTIQALHKNLVHKAAMSELLTALNALQAHTLLEKAGDGLTLQNVVIEYLTERLIQAVCAEIGDGAAPRETAWLHRFALLKAQAREYVRASQSRLMLQPVTERLLATLGAPALADRLSLMLEALHASPPQLRRGYSAGNLLNLTLNAGLNAGRMRFAGLTLREAFLREHSLAGVDFSNTDLTGAMFGDSFSACHNVTYHSPSATLAASTSNGEIRLWDMEGSRLLSILRGHVKVVWALAGNPKRDQLASGGEDGSVRLWQRMDNDDERWLGRVLHQSEAIVRAVAFHPGGGWLASAGDDLRIRLWDAASGNALGELHGHTDWVTALAFSPDGRWLASCANDRTVRLWTAAAAANGDAPHSVLHELPASAPSFWCLAWAPDGRTLVGGTLDGNLWAWDIPEHTVLHTGAAHAGMLTKLSFSADGAILASAGEDSSIRLWDARSWQLIRQLQGHSKRVSAIAFHPQAQAQALASVGLDNTVRVWNIERGLATQIQTGRSIGINAICFGGDDLTLHTATSDGGICTWALPDLEQPQHARARITRVLASGAGVVASMAIDKAHTRLITGGHDHSVRVWDARSGELQQMLCDHQHIVFGVAFHPDGGTFASSAIDLTARIWDARSGRCLHVLSHELAPGVMRNGTWSAAYSADGRTLAVGYTDGAIVLWSLPDAAVSGVLRGHGNWVRGLAFSNDGARLVSAGNDGQLCVWDARSHALLHTLSGHTDWVMGVALSPDGATIASCSQDQTVRLWRMDDPSAPPVVLRGHTAGVHKIAFSPSGSLLASNDGGVRIWRVRDGALLFTLRPPGLYEGMNLTNAIGLSSAQRSVVAHLGAILNAEP